MRNKLLLCLLCVTLILSACGREKDTESSTRSEASASESSEEEGSSEESSAEESSIDDSSAEEISVEESSEEEPFEEEPQEDTPEEVPSEENQEAADEEESPDESTHQHEVTLDTRDTWGGKRYLDVMHDLATFINPTESIVYDLILEDAATLYDLDLLPTEALACPYPLEGYLLPDAYSLDYIGLSYTHQIVKHSIETVQQYIEESGSDLSLHEVLTRASIVQIEAMRGGESEVAYPEVMPYIASVIENRLADGTPLQMDVTYRYAQFLLENTDLSEEEALAYDTYEASALPPGPICMPSLEAVQAVLHPAETDDFFFVYDADGNYYFAASYDDHLANCEKAGIY